eukprot:TRINITY_DN60993_c0_g1_i1.p1 TRINITY_DN60993_c0_g1~~TRINITY_DN60993_c0_g1_i1.p1  ORF type:complete len:1046 (-),score=147.26 TRINITY_DN60993_c0_g1_i1:1205-4342(-)
MDSNFNENDTDTASEEDRLIENVDDTDDSQDGYPSAAARHTNKDMERETERILTGAEFTALYQKNIAKHRLKGGAAGPKVAFDEHKLFHAVGGAPSKAKGSKKPRSSARALYSQAHPRLYTTTTTTTTPRAAKRSSSSTHHPSSGRRSSKRDAVSTSFGAAGDHHHDGGASVFASFLSQGDALRKRTIPPKDLLEPESLYMELMKFKQRNIQLENENQGNKIKLRKIQKENITLEHRVDELFRSSAVVGGVGSGIPSANTTTSAAGTIMMSAALVGTTATSAADITPSRPDISHAETNLVRNLRSKIRMLETNLALVMEEYNKLKLDGKYLRVRELETEVKAYYSETRRLQRILDQVTQSRNKDSEKEALDEALALLQDREQNILRLRDEVATLKQSAKHQKMQIDTLHDDHDRTRNDAQMQLSDLVRQLDEAHSLANMRQIENQQLQEQLTTASQQAEDYAAETQRMDTALRKLRNDIDLITKENAKLSTDHETDTILKAELTSELHNCKLDMKEAVDKAKQLEIVAGDSQRIIQAKDNDIEMLKDQFNRLKNDNEFSESERHQLAQEAEKRLLEVADLKDEITTLKADLAEEQAEHTSAKERLQYSLKEHQEQVRKLKDEHSSELEDSHFHHSAAVEQHQRAYAEEAKHTLAEKEEKWKKMEASWKATEAAWKDEKEELEQKLYDTQLMLNKQTSITKRLESLLAEMELKHKSEIELLEREMQLSRTRPDSGTTLLTRQVPVDTSTLAAVPPKRTPTAELQHQQQQKQQPSTSSSSSSGAENNHQGQQQKKKKKSKKATKSNKQDHDSSSSDNDNNTKQPPTAQPPTTAAPPRRSSVSGGGGGGPPPPPPSSRPPSVPSRRRSSVASNNSETGTGGLPLKPPKTTTTSTHPPPKPPKTVHHDVSGTDSEAAGGAGGGYSTAFTDDDDNRPRKPPPADLSTTSEDTSALLSHQTTVSDLPKQKNIEKHTAKEFSYESDEYNSYTDPDPEDDDDENNNKKKTTKTGRYAQNYSSSRYSESSAFDDYDDTKDDSTDRRYTDDSMSN